MCPKCGRSPLRSGIVDGHPGRACVSCGWAEEPPASILDREFIRHTASAVQNALQPMQAVSAPQKGNKYGARKTECAQGHMHASAKESRRCDELHLRQRAGEIDELVIEPVYEFKFDGVLIGKYRPDFKYTDKVALKWVVEDVKSTATRTTAYRLRKRMMYAFFGIEVQEV